MSIKYVYLPNFFLRSVQHAEGEIFQEEIKKFRDKKPSCFPGLVKKTGRLQKKYQLLNKNHHPSRPIALPAPEVLGFYCIKTIVGKLKEGKNFPFSLASGAINQDLIARYGITFPWATVIPRTKWKYCAQCYRYME